MDDLQKKSNLDRGHQSGQGKNEVKKEHGIPAVQLSRFREIGRLDESALRGLVSLVSLLSLAL